MAATKNTKKNTAPAKKPKSSSKSNATFAKSNTASTAKKRASSERKTKASSAGSAPDQKEKEVIKNQTAIKTEPAGIPMKKEGLLVLSFGVMVLLTLSNFGLCGTIGNDVSSVLFGIFGCVQYVMPFAAFFAAVMLIRQEFSLLSIQKLWAGFITLLMMSSFAQIIYQGEDVKLEELFSLSMRDHSTGGILGGGFSILLKQGFDIAGALIIIACIIILALVLLTQRSFVEFSRSIARDSRKWMGEYKEHAKDREQKRQEKAEKKKEQKEEKGGSKEAKDDGFWKSLWKETTQLQDELTLDESVDERVKELEKQVKEKNEPKEAFFDELADEKTTYKKPVFTSDYNIKHKDEVKELHMTPYPFTAEDGKNSRFESKLDFTAFSFSSDKTPEEYAEEIRIRTLEFEKKRGEENVALPSYAAGTNSHMKELTARPDQREAEEDFVQLIHDVEETKEEDFIPGFLGNSENVQTMLQLGNQASDAKRMSQIQIHSEDIHKQTDAKNTTKKSKKTQNTKSTGKLRRVDPVGKEDYIFPPINLLYREDQRFSQDHDIVLKETALKLQQTLESFGVNVTITDISCGPTVTRYEMVPEQGTKVSRIVSLTDDIKLNLAAADIRIEAPIPGKAAIGIEVPNQENHTVHLRDLIDSDYFHVSKSNLSIAIGKDIGGKTVISDLAKMPHLLIAGATGSGKSVCINTIIMSLLYKASPEDVKMIMIDPKKVELSIYNDIPHLLIPVVTNPKKASGALNWAVAEMLDRYEKFSESNVRNIEGYNEKVALVQNLEGVNEQQLKKMPQIVIIIDELADLMMASASEVEEAIVRLSQLARAAGIHLVIATQRPSVNVITGLIKANVPSRIAFAVSSGVDSRTILDMNGAEKLLGKGDMLFFPSGYPKPIRVQGAFVSDDEVAEVVDFLRENENMGTFIDIEEKKAIEEKMQMTESSSEKDEYFEAAARFVMEKEKASVGMLQSMFRIGFNRARRIMDQMEEAGIVGPEQGTKPRAILMSPEQLQTYLEEYN